MADLALRPARADDVAALVADLRPLDRAEVEAMAGPDVESVIARALATTPDCTAVDWRGELACLFGTMPQSLISDTGQVWMLGTTLMHQLGRPLGIIAHRYISEASRTYPLLVNYVDARNAPSLRLIRWLGFDVQPAEPFGVAGLPFHRFELRSDPDRCAPATEQPPSPVPPSAG